ncbi:MAG: hypothetical protein IKZ09_13090 [Clostridia bacterium]|nr:hypothetical protein [Clostridia bacterium]
MKHNRNRFRVRSPLHDNILSLTAIVSLILLTLAAVSAILWLLVRSGMLSYDWWRFDPPTEETVVYDQADGVFDALRPGSSATADQTNEIVRFSGSFLTLRTLLSDMNAPDDYNALFETVIYADAASAKQTVRVCRSADSYRINRYPDGTSLSGTPTEAYVCDGEAVAYTDNRAHTSVHFPVSESFSVEALAGIPSVASFNAVPDEQILHASYTELNGEIVYYVLYTTPNSTENRIVHEIWISASTELVQRCNTYLCPTDADPFAIIADGTHRIFSSTLLSVSDLSAYEKRTLFVLPEIKA